jgi:hypothetical protein
MIILSTAHLCNLEVKTVNGHLAKRAMRMNFKLEYRAKRKS